jgi:hypothetical protein
MGFLAGSVASGAGALTSRWMRTSSLASHSASEQLQATGPQRCTWFEAACGRAEACVTRRATTLLPEVPCSRIKCRRARWCGVGRRAGLAVTSLCG